MNVTLSKGSVLDCIRWATTYLNSCGVEDAVINAERIFAHLSGLSKTEIYLEASKEMDDCLWEEFSALIGKRALRYPLQYILGSVEFFGLNFIISESVLIPRPETEILVEKSLSLLYSEKREGNIPEILDLGTGSGNISASIAKTNPEALITATDISYNALLVARGNAVSLELEERIDFLVGDLFEAIGEKGKFDLVVSNPPYIPVSDFNGLAPELSHEPRIALDGKRDGLFYIKKIIQESPRYLKNNGALLIEIGFGQVRAVKELFLSSEFRKMKIEKDYRGIERVVILHK